MRKTPAVFLLLFLTVLTGIATAEVDPHGLFYDGAVLQRDTLIPVWGWDNAGQSVTIDFKRQSKTTLTGSDGKWMVYLDPMNSDSTGSSMTITGSSVEIISDILVGEVWIAAGQSNMVWSVSALSSSDRDEIHSKTYDKIRCIGSGNGNQNIPQEDIGWGTGLGYWYKMDPSDAANLDRMSAVAYFFAESIYLSQGVPVGIILAAQGGTSAETWTPLDAMEAHPLISPYVVLDSSPDPYSAGVNFNSKIHPLAPYAFRGVIWYQGESNSGNSKYQSNNPALTGELYLNIMDLMISTWRNLWDRDFPFYYVQLPLYGPGGTVPAEENGWCYVKAVQEKLLQIENTAMAIITDTGEYGDIHPHNKKPVGERLARLAKSRIYGESFNADSGPILQSTTVNGNQIELTFKYADGLITTGDNLEGFAITDASDPSSRDWVFASSQRILGNKVILSHNAMDHPKYIRYDWSRVPSGNLANSSGIPASIMHSDPIPWLDEYFEPDPGNQIPAAPQNLVLRDY